MAALAAACLAGLAPAEAAPEPVAVSGEFHRVVLRVPLRLEVTEGETALAVAAEPAVRQRLRIQVRNDDLVIGSERDLPRGARGLVTVRMEEFRGLRVDGSGDATWSGSGEVAGARVSGSGEVRRR